MSGHVLVINAGSSSLKLQVVDPSSGAAQATALVERLGSDAATYRVSVASDEARGEQSLPDVSAALALVIDQLRRLGVDLRRDPPVAVGHRVVHGGRSFTQPTLIDDRVLEEIERVAPLAPLHNPGNLAGIRSARKAFPDIPHVAVFDTAFFADLPEAAATYAIDRELGEKYAVRRYGFHGTSHEYVSHEAARFLGRDYGELRQIVLHLGNGASASAVDHGRAVETSMGMTPLEGLVMGTRGGDLDPGVLLQLARVGGMTVHDLDVLLSKRSGLLGLTGRSDMRDVVESAESGDAAAQLALDVVAHRLRKYIGAYAAVLGGIDVLTFTGGIGENSVPVRAAALSGLEFLGLQLDSARNEATERGARVISADGSPVTVLVVPTNEEFAIARHTLDVISPK